MTPRPSVFQLWIGTVLHKIPYREMKRCLDLIDKHQLPVTYTELGAHHLAGGRMTSWIDGLIYARARGLKLSPAIGAALDLLEAHGSKRSLREQIQILEASGFKNLDSATFNGAAAKHPNPARAPTAPSPSP